MLIPLLRLLFPLNCEACGQALVGGERVLCTTCRYQLPKTGQWLQEGNPVEQVFWGRIPIERACSYFYFHKGSKFRQLVHKLKYLHKPQIGVELGKYFGTELKQSAHYASVDYIVPIPLHPKRQYARGYNQSEQLALGLSEVLGKPVLTSVVYRKVYNETQTRKTREERIANVQDIFTLHQATPIKGKHVLLVDDILTTGATLEACAHTILQGVECKISIVTLAVAN